MNHPFREPGMDRTLPKKSFNLGRFLSGLLVVLSTLLIGVIITTHVVRWVTLAGGVGVSAMSSQCNPKGSVESSQQLKPLGFRNPEKQCKITWYFERVLLGENTFRTFEQAKEFGKTYGGCTSFDLGFSPKKP